MSLRTAFDHAFQVVVLGLLAPSSASLLRAEPILPRPVPAGEFAARRSRVIEGIVKAGGERAVLLLRASPEDIYAGDVSYPYRPDNDLYYLTGIDEPGCALLLSAEHADRRGELLFLAPNEAGARVWIGEKLSREQACERSGIALESVVDAGELRERIRGLGLTQGAKSSRAFFFETGPGFAPGRSATEPYGFMVEALGSSAFHLDLHSPGELLGRHRQVKSSAEVAQIEKAIDATSKAFARAWRAIKPGIYEFEIRAVIEGTFIKEGCPGWGFPPIVGSGPNTCILHHERYDRRTEDGDLVVLDIGAEYGHYSADVTRTVPVNGRFSPRQRQVYEAVLRAQEAAIRVIRPGVPHRQVHMTAFREVTEGLKALGLITKDEETYKYFLHGTSHGLGLDVHDAMPEPTLAPGMVITVEPGIYIPGENLGVRIEEDVLVTETGYRVLSESAPKTVEEIEGFMESREF